MNDLQQQILGSQQQPSIQPTVRFLEREMQDEEISELDPLSLDEFFLILPNLNSSSDVNAVVQALELKIPTEEVLSNLDIVSASAALRDLGHIAASLRRHGVHANLVPKLEKSLLILGGIIGEVPRDTVYSYGARNPKGDRRRTFTNLSQERLFIQSFNDGMSGLNQTIELLYSLRDIPLDDPRFSDIVQGALTTFTSMVNAILLVYRDIPAEVFTRDLRPYFDPINIGGFEYLAPGGAQMPILLIDMMLWANSTSDGEYLAYLDDNLRYCPTVYRTLAQNIRSDYTALMDRVLKESSRLSEGEQKQIVRNSLTALRELFTTIIKFRRPHLRVANDNFALRRDDQLGSGGYKPDLLEILVSKTEAHKAILSNLLSE